MSEKKVKQERKQARQVVAEFTITAYSDNSVQIVGPFQDFIMYRQIMNRAEMAAIQSIAESQQSRIIKPNPGLKILN